MKKKNKKGPLEKLDEKLEGNKVYDFYWHHIWAPICRIFYYKPKEFFHNIKLFFQRGRLGYTHEDYWALNYSSAKFFAGVLKDWSKNMNSYIPEIKGQKFTAEEWECFIADSAQAFQEWIDIEEGEDPFLRKPKTKERHDICLKKIKRFFYIMGECFEGMWD